MFAGPYYWEVNDKRWRSTKRTKVGLSRCTLHSNFGRFQQSAPIRSHCVSDVANNGVCS